ncbi:MAG: hypothetical protein LCH37_13875 [Bacteroidetes bacterium]|nr:hypothetical protein [Bacteroidota bacterium]
MKNNFAIKTLGILVFLVVNFSCKKNTTTSVESSTLNQSYAQLIGHYNNHSKRTLNKTNSEGSPIGFNDHIDSDSIPVILDLLLNYNLAEPSSNFENQQTFEFSYQVSTNEQNISPICELDSLYALMEAKINDALLETTDPNEVIYYVTVEPDGSQTSSQKGLTLRFKKGWGALQLVPKVFLSNMSFRAHSGVLNGFGAKTYYGGLCGQYVSFYPGASDVLNSFANFNLNLSAPAPPPNFRYIYVGETDKSLHANETYDPSYPSFNINNYVNNVPMTFYPTRVYACATQSSWIEGRNTQDDDPINHFNTTEAPCINSGLMNYYLNSIAILANQYQQPFQKAVSVAVSSHKGTINNCVPWNSPVNPSFNTGKSIDQGVCAIGQHSLIIKYKTLVLVPMGL